MMKSVTVPGLESSLHRSKVLALQLLLLTSLLLPRKNIRRRKLTRV
jgi:hypothetical protein